MYNNQYTLTISGKGPGQFQSEIEPELISELFYRAKPVVEYLYVPFWDAADSFVPLLNQLKGMYEEKFIKKQMQKLRPEWCKHLKGGHINTTTPDGRWVYDVNYVGSMTDFSAKNLAFSFCTPPKQYSGKGILVASHQIFRGYQPGIKINNWPKEAYQYPAGEYPATSLSLGVDKQLKQLIPLGVLVVPTGWKVRVFDESKQGKPHKDIIGPSIINGQDLVSNINSYSMSVRGPWTLQDVFHFDKLMAQMPQWITQNWPKKPVEEDVTALILMDPRRKVAVNLDDPIPAYKSTWGEGWEKDAIPVMRMLIESTPEVKRRTANRFTVSGPTVGGLKASETETINAAVGLATPIIDSFVPGLGTAIGSLTPIITGFFADKPCDPAGASMCKIQTSWDGRVHYAGYVECCNPMQSGLGVLLTQHAPGYKKWPGIFDEVAAGDYWGMSRETVFDKFGSEDYPHTKLPEGELSGVVIPQGWAVQLFSEIGFRGQSISLPPGVHNLHQLKWGDRTQSMKVRGPWGWYDYLAGKQLVEQRPGWLTFAIGKDPKPQAIVKMVLGDPNRVLSLKFDDPVVPWEPFWSPGWNHKLAELKKLAKASPKTRLKLAKKRAEQAMKKAAAQQKAWQRQWQQET